MKLLNIDANPKTVKGQKLGYMTAVLYLAPWKLSGYQVCAMAELAGCIVGCLNTAGRGGMARKDAETLTIGAHKVKLNAIQKARIARTRLFMEQPELFKQMLLKEIRQAQAQADGLGLTLVIRLDGTSDIRWEDVDMGDGQTIFQLFPTIQFYDYTKIPNRDVSHIPNYHLTYSYSNRPEFAKYVERAIQHYGPKINLAVVFQGALPDTFMGRKVINGDESDLRFLDEPGVIVGLKAKGNAKKSQDGFAVAA